MNLKQLFDIARIAHGEGGHTQKEAAKIVGISNPRLSAILAKERTDVTGDGTMDAITEYTITGLCDALQDIQGNTLNEKQISAIRAKVARARITLLEAKRK